MKSKFECLKKIQVKNDYLYVNIEKIKILKLQLSCIDFFLIERVQYILNISRAPISLLVCFSVSLCIFSL